MIANNSLGVYLLNKPIYKIYLNTTLIYNAIKYWKSSRSYSPALIVEFLLSKYIPKELTNEPPISLFVDSEGNYLTFDDGGYIINNLETSNKYNKIN